MNLAVRIDQSGITIIKAVIIKETPIERSAQPSNYVYEIACGKQTIAAAFVADSLLQTRAFPVEEGPEKVTSAKAATIVLNVPWTREVAECCPRLRFHKIMMTAPIEKMNPTIFGELRNQHRLQLLREVSGDKICALLRKRN